jgi:hypothetical protein
MSSAQTDQAIENALKDTQDLLKDNSKRQELFKKDSNAKAADDQVQNVTGGDSAQSQEIYNISSDAFSAVMQSAGNDPNKVMEMLNKAKGDPKAFYDSLPAEIRNKIRGVASDIEKKQAPKNNP